MLLLFTIAIFLGAGLLFLVQPMVAKMLLPGLGGSPAVWNTCMVFFQAALLAGYAYAHGIGDRLGQRRGPTLHIIVLLLPLAVLWLGGPAGRAPSPEAWPVGWLLMTLAATVGLPFVVVSTGAPLLQRWFAATAHARARDPYFLYAASNAGSLLALLGYPLILERLVGVREQWTLWSAGYILWAALVLACAAVVLRRNPPGTAPDAPTSPSHNAPHASSSESITWPRRLLWIALAFAPSSLMLGATQYLSTDIAAVPLLWVVPLAIYLLTFILAFAQRQILPLASASRLLPILAVALALAFLLEAKRPIAMLIVMHLAFLLFAALVCHGRLASLRPPASRLTEYYLWIAVGGVLGGVFNALIAPIAFTGVYEYPIALVIACLLRPPVATEDRAEHSRENAQASTTSTLPARAVPWLRVMLGLEPGSPRLAFILDAAIPCCIAFLMLAMDFVMRMVESRWFPRGSGHLDVVILYGVPAFLVFLLAYRPIRFALGFGVLLMVAHISHSAGSQLLYASRSFFGVHRVQAVRNIEPGGTVRTVVQLKHGTTLHGLQDHTRPDQPLAYYHPEGPIGLAFRTMRAADERALRSVGLIGLGTGAMAAYRRDGDHFVFFEIDPEVVRIAQRSEWFTYLRDARERGGDGGVDIILGDGRHALAAHQGGFDILVLDAFSSDAIPTHLLTREAVELYMRCLATGGLLAFHISNRYLILEPVLAAIADELGLVAISRNDSPIRPEDGALGRFDSNWVILARSHEDLAPLHASGHWVPIPYIPGFRAWTDDYSNVLRVFDWGLQDIFRAAR